MSLASVKFPADWQQLAPASLAGRVIVVTGAYGGLGSAVARAAARAPASLFISPTF